MSCVTVSLILPMCYNSRIYATAVGAELTGRGRGQAQKRQHQNSLPGPLLEPRLLVGRFLAANLRQYGSLDILHVDAYADVVAQGLEFF
jgi:hypothetical protein